MKRLLSLILLAVLAGSALPIRAQADDFGSANPVNGTPAKKHRRHRKHHKNHHKGHLTPDKYPQG